MTSDRKIHRLNGREFKKPDGSKYYLNGESYSSLSEAACSFLLQVFVSGFSPVVRGENFEIELGRGCRADFLVNNVILEWHPIKLRKSWHLRARFLPQPYKSQFLEKNRDRVLGQYREKRGRQILKSEKYSHCELVVAGSPKNLHAFLRTESTISLTRNLPTEEDFCLLFERVQKIISCDNANLNPQKWKRALGR